MSDPLEQALHRCQAEWENKTEEVEDDDKEAEEEV